MTLKQLIDAGTIAGRVAELAAEIDELYKGETVVVICVLKGAFPFSATWCAP